MLTTSELTKLADAAFRQAAEAVVKRAEATGTPVIVWQDNKVVALSPAEARKALEAEKGQEKTRTKKSGKTKKKPH